MALERPLPTVESARSRLASVRGERHRTELELQYCPRWRWLVRHRLRCEVARLSGLAEGLRLSVGLAEDGVFPPTIVVKTVLDGKVVAEAVAKAGEDSAGRS